VNGSGTLLWVITGGMVVHTVACLLIVKLLL